MAHSNRDSNSIRASVYDVFLELGALDSNSQVAEWIFTDPSYVLPDPDEVAWRSPREAVRFADGSRRRQGFQRGGNEVDADAESKSTTSRPPSSSKSFGLNFSPKRSRTRASTKSTSSPTSSPGSPSDGYETDEGYISASSTPKKSRVRPTFSLSSTRSSPVPAAEITTKPLPSLPPIREKLTRKVSSSSVARAKSLFRKRPKSPVESADEDDLQEWHEVSALSPRIYNPSVDNGVALAPPPPSSFRQVPPSSFRQVVDAVTDTEPATTTGRNRDSLTFALPRTIFRTMSITKRRLTPRARPRSLNLAGGPDSPRLATSMPSSPFILVTEGEQGGAASAGPHTPFVFVTSIDNPTPLGTANSMRRFSDVTSMTAPLGMGVYPLSISRTLRRSMVFDKLEPSFPRPRSSSFSSLQDALAASAASPYDLYNQPIPGIQRGKEAPFPSRPILPQPLSATVGAFGGESRMATIQRYREFSEQLVELTPYKRFVNSEI
ncbi:hypothetical protein B0H19DRAFT_1103365 [Mycena capillaripes]|nr:hypothetical protein B0H19DRAFT_1103365 [Mycena capillaripes]